MDPHPAASLDLNNKLKSSTERIEKKAISQVNNNQDIKNFVYPEADLGGPPPGALFNGRDRERKASSLQYHGYKIIKISRISCIVRLTSGTHQPAVSLNVN